MTNPGDLPELPDLTDESPDPAHDELRVVYRALRVWVLRHQQQFRDRDEAAGDRLEITGAGEEWTWTRYDAQGRTLGTADKPYSRKADAVRGGQRANPDL